MGDNRAMPSRFNQPRGRSRWVRTPLVVLLAAVVVVALAAVGLSQTTSNGSPSGAATATLTSSTTKTVKTKALPTKAASYLGVHESQFPASYSQTTSFKNAAGRWPNVALYYSGFPEKFQTTFASKARSHGAVTLVDIDPGSVPLKSITDGKYNTFLKQYADEVKSYGHPVMISFGHEMNGTWYKWGSGHVTPATFIAAWRHIVGYFRAQGADNVTWVWTVTALDNGKYPAAKWYPGKDWVNWVAMDGYIYRKSNDFSNTFGHTLKQVRGVAKGKPVFIGETAIGPVAGQAKKIPGLVEAVKKNKLLGFLWFDKNQDSGVLHQKWRIDSNAAAKKALKNALKKHFNKLSSTAS
jgi:mannan endo-1,4-beta-mannosidase